MTADLVHVGYVVDVEIRSDGGVRTDGVFREAPACLGGCSGGSRQGLPQAGTSRRFPDPGRRPRGDVAWKLLAEGQTNNGNAN